MAVEDPFHSPDDRGTRPSPGPEALAEGVRRLRQAARAGKCRSCGCLHDTLDSLEKAPESLQTPEIRAVRQEAHSRLVPRKYDCLGCETCFPALAVNAFNQADQEAGLAACAAENPRPQEGWPPLPGSYKVLRYRAPVAVCTLTDEPLCSRLASEADGALSIVGSLMTENLGIERLLQNVLANPHIRFLILCGADSLQDVGHLPGRSLLALARNGVDGRNRILGAGGKRPVLKNLSREAVEHFRQTVEVVDRVGQTALPALREAVRACRDRDPGPAPPFAVGPGPARIPGSLPERMTADPAGYFVVYVDRAGRSLLLEHYRNDGLLDAVVEGKRAAELYFPAIERGLLSRLDHAAYLGKELARAEEALRTGGPYVQDAAPEKTRTGSCGCGSNCREEVRHDPS